MRVLNFGSMNLDHVYQVPHFSQPGESLSVTELATGPGGKGLNQSIAMARAGATVFQGGCLGAGGERLKTLLEENGVDTSLLWPVDEAQGHAIIQVAPDGENSILYYGGSNRCVTEAQIEQTLAPCTQGDLLVLQNEIVLLAEIIEQANAKGMTILLNPSPFDETLQQVDFGNLPVRKTESQKHLRRTLTKTVVKNIPDLNAVDGYKDITRLDTDFLGDTTRNDFLYDAVLFSSIGHLSFSSSSR